MEPYHYFATLAGLGYAVAAILSKRALMEGSGVLRLSFVFNLVCVVVFAVPYLGGNFEAPRGPLYLPVLVGLFLFLGQVFTFAAIRVGDVSLQTPMMGLKPVFVVVIAVVLGTEPVGPLTIAAAILAMLAVILLGFSGGGAKRVGLTLALATLSCVFFAAADTMIGAFGASFGIRHFVFLAVLVSGLLSLSLIPFFNRPITETPRSAWKWMLMGAIAMGVQSMVMSYSMAVYQNVVVINILYTTRGLWSVVLALPLAILLSLPREGISRYIFFQRLVGALLMMGAVALGVSG